MKVSLLAEGSSSAGEATRQNPGPTEGRGTSSYFLEDFSGRGFLALALAGALPSPLAAAFAWRLGCGPLVGGRFRGLTGALVALGGGLGGR